MKSLTYFLFLVTLTVSSLSFASSGEADLPEMKHIDPLHRTESLQHGAKIFVNYCLGCHSAKYVRYERLREDLGLTKEELKSNLMFTSDKVGDTLTIALQHDQAKKWFGAAPPDLSLEARLRGANWVYNYLTGFYPDESRPFGYNNHVFPSVGMPFVLESMQKDMTEIEFDKSMYDLTNFLDYIAEPIKKERIELGRWVIAFLILIMLPVTLWLNHEYWKYIH